jgi:hypothetical protein
LLSSKTALCGTKENEMRHQRKLIISVLAFMLLAGISVISSTTRLAGNIVEAQSPPPPPPGDLVPLYHFIKYPPDVYGPYTTNEASHYYVAGEEGKKNAEKFHYILTDQGTRPQGVEGYVSLKELPGTVPLYYLHNGELGTTMSEDTRDSTVPWVMFRRRRGSAPCRSTVCPAAGQLQARRILINGLVTFLPSTPQTKKR